MWIILNEVDFFCGSLFLQHKTARLWICLLIYLCHLISVDDVIKVTSDKQLLSVYGKSTSNADNNEQ